MAEHTRTDNSRTAQTRHRWTNRSEVVIGAVTIGVVTAAVGITPARAEDAQFPSWQDVQAAKHDAAAEAKEVKRITALLVELQDASDTAGRVSQIAAEHALQAAAAERQAKQRLADLQGQVASAQRTAATSRMRAGLLAASLARSGGGDMSLDLALNGAHADDLLYQLAEMAQLSTQSHAIYQRAVADQNTAASLGAQAALAATDLQAAAQAAETALAAAEQTSAAAAAAVTTQQANADRLTAQLADLQNTSSATAAAYIQGVQQRHDDEVAAAQAAAAAAAAAAKKHSGGSTPISAASGAPPSDPSSGASSAPAPGASSAPAPTPAPAPTQSAAPTPAPVPAPNSAKAAAAVAFARDQIGDQYRFGGAGPNAWDCSGLTMQSYASVGISIGGHSATAQYNLAKSEGLLVPFADIAVGDLIFYTDGGGDMYHVAIYSGGGKMIEAPYEGVPVREVAVRAYQLVGKVARFTG